MLFSSVAVCLLLSTLSVVAKGESAVLSLTKELFDQKLKEGPMLVEFFAPWCGHCKHLEPIYEQLATQLKDRVTIAKVDCTIEKELQQMHQIRGFPTIKLFKDGAVLDYKGGRDVTSFVNYLESQKALKDASSSSTASTPSNGPHVELRYFALRGRAEVIRLTLEDIGIKYSDTRYSNEEWAKVKPDTTLFPFAQVPSLSIDGLDLVQTGAILRYLGRKHNLYGENALEQTNIDIAIGGFEDLLQKYGQLVYDSEFETKKEKYLSEVLPVWLTHFERLLQKNHGGSAYFVGNRMSIADIVAFDLLSLQEDLSPACFASYPLLQRFLNRMQQRPNLKNYLSSSRRPQYAHGNSASWNNEAHPPHSARV